MLVKQISVFLENKAGRLAEVARILANSNIDIRALSIADTTDFGILRLIVNKPDNAERILKDSGFTVSCTDVIAIAVPDKPGGLDSALSALAKESLGIEYMYAFISKSSSEAIVILRVEKSGEAIKILQKNNIKVLPSNFIYSL